MSTGISEFLRFIWHSMSGDERSRFTRISIFRICLVILDVVGLASLGLWVSTLTSASFPAAIIGVPVPTAIRESALVSPIGLGLVSAFLLVARGLLTIWLNSRVVDLASNIEVRMSSDYLRKVLLGRLDGMDAFPKAKLGHLVIETTSKAFGQGIISFSIISGELALIVAISAFLSVLKIGLFSLVALLFSLIGIALSKAVSERIADAAKLVDDSKKKASSSILDIQATYKQIYAHKTIGFFVQSFQGHRMHMAKSLGKIVSLTALPRFVLEFGLVLGIAIVFVGTNLGLLGLNVSAPVLAIFIAGIFKLVSAVLPFQNQYNLLKQINSESAEAFRLQERPAMEGSEADFQKISREIRNNFSIRIEKLSFKYAGSSTKELFNISTEIPFGSYVSLEGKSGSGKSTFVDVLLGLRSPATGKIFIDDRPASDLLAVVRVGFVPQSTQLISGTLLENILFGTAPDSCSDIDLNQAIIGAGLTEFVNDLPLGLETKISRHSEFSGGQIQRIGLARALVHRPQVLILDEATSSLDAHNSQGVLEAVSKLKSKATIFVISHKQSEQKEADIRLNF